VHYHRRPFSHVFWPPQGTNPVWLWMSFSRDLPPETFGFFPLSSCFNNFQTSSAENFFCDLPSPFPHHRVHAPDAHLIPLFRVPPPFPPPPIRFFWVKSTLFELFLPTHFLSVVVSYLDVPRICWSCPLVSMKKRTARALGNAHVFSKPNVSFSLALFRVHHHRKQAPPHHSPFWIRFRKLRVFSPV